MAHCPPNTNQPMENQAPFDLNPALQQWRASLQNLGDFSADELEELEGHLRESMAALHARGLSDQEAFMIATRRLGSERQLSDEFAKAHPQRTWTERALWMVAGVLVSDTLSVVAAPLPILISNCALQSGMSGHLVGALQFIASWISWAGAAAVVYWVFSSLSPRRDRLVATCIRRPVLAGLGLFIGLECLQSFMLSVYRFAIPLYRFIGGHNDVPKPEAIATMTSWCLWGGLLTQMLWVAAGPLLAGYAWRKRDRSAPGSPTSSGPQLGEQEAARVLQGQGLSIDEAGLVLARRRGRQEVVAPSLAVAGDGGIWLERGVWMVSGVTITRCLEWLVLEPAWIVAGATRPTTPLLQHLAGLASVCLGPVLAGAIIAGVWRWITLHPRQSASIGCVCRLRPLLAAMALAVVYAGVWCCAYVLGVYVVRTANIGVGGIGSQWMTYGGALTRLIIPIALLLWLARRHNRLPSAHPKLGTT